MEEGTRVELLRDGVFLDRGNQPIETPAGMLGTVLFVGDGDEVDVQWDNNTRTSWVFRALPGVDLQERNGRVLSPRQRQRIEAGIREKRWLNGFIGGHALTASVGANGYTVWRFGRSGRAGGGGDPDMWNAIARIIRQLEDRL